MDNFTDIKHSAKGLLKLFYSDTHFCSINQKHQGQNNIPKKLLTNIHPHNIVPLQPHLQSWQTIKHYFFFDFSNADSA